MTEYVQNSPPSNAFAFDVWVTNGGSAIPTDAAPTTFDSVPSSRLTRLIQKNGSLLVSGQGVMRVACVGGTSVTYTPYVWDATQSLWLPIAASTTVNTSALPTLLQGYPFFGGYFYCRVTSVSGATGFGYHAG